MRASAFKSSEIFPTGWFRPLVVTSVVAIHAAVLAAGSMIHPKAPVVDALEVAIDTSDAAIPEAAMRPQPDPEPEPQNEPELPPDPPSEEAPLEPPPPADDLVPPPLETPIPPPAEPEPPQAKEPSKPQLSPVELERQKEKRIKAQQQAIATAQKRQAMAAEAAQARATFGSIVAARINAAKFYPSEARSSGSVGVVGVKFAIGADGRVTQASISQSSGSSVLDAAALQIFQSLHAPEPPGGFYSGLVNIRYSLARH